MEESKNEKLILRYLVSNGISIFVYLRGLHKNKIINKTQGFNQTQNVNVYDKCLIYRVYILYLFHKTINLNNKYYRELASINMKI